MDAHEALNRLEERIREQEKIAPVGSMEWRAHMADLMHLKEVRAELEKNEL